MAKIRKINVSEIGGRSPFNQDNDAIMPSGTVVIYEKNINGIIEYVLRVHDGVTNGGVPFANAPSIIHNDDVNITVDSGDSSSYTWNFGQTGTLTAPGTAIFNGTDGIVVDNLNPGIAGLFNNGDVYITGGNSLRFTGLDTDSGGSTSVLRFWNAEGRHSSGNDPTELVTLNVGNDAAPGVETLGFLKIITEKEVGGQKEWKFDSDGVLHLPTNGDIIDSNGDSVLGGSSNVDNNIWVETFATNDQEGTIVQIATSVEYDADGNIFTLFSHNIPGIEYETYKSVAKLTPTGAVLWQVRFSANLNTDGWGLAYDGGDSVYIAGSTSGPGLDYTLATLTKIDAADGTSVWSKTYDFGSNSRSAVVDVDSDLNPIMVGWADTPEEENNRIITTKVDQATGSVVWSRTLDGQGDDEAYGMAVGPTGEVVTVGYVPQLGFIDAADDLYADLAGNLNWTIGGQFTGTDGLITADFTFTDGFPTFTNIVDEAGGRTIDDIVATVPGSAIGGVDGVDDMVVKVATLAANDNDNRMVVIKYAGDGTIAWQKAVQFEVGYDCKGADADIDADGNIYVCGSYDNFVGEAMSLVKFNSSGVKQWSRQVIGNCQDFATSVVVGPDNNLYLSGVTIDNNNEDINWVVAKYSTGGTVVWQRLINNTASWTFAGGTFIGEGGGSNIAVRNGYVALGGGFGILEGGDDPTAAVVQIDTNGTPFSTGDWDFTGASFSGTLDDTASGITVVDAGKTSGTATPAVENFIVNEEASNFLIVTRYSLAGGNDSLVNGDYTLALGDTGTVTLPAGGTITEGVVTSNPTIQLTPATPTVASQKLVIKGGAQYSAEDNGIYLTWNEINPQVTDTVNIVVVANTYANQTLYWWITPADVIADPGFGTVEIDGSGNGVFTFTVDSDDYEFTVRVSPEDNNYDPDSIGVETQLFNADAPTYGDQHLHLTTGDLTETSIIVGTDDHNVRTTVDGGVEINTYLYPSGGGSGKWTFDNSGNLTLPLDGDILDSNGTSVLGGSSTATGVSRSDDNLIIRLTDPNDDGLELRSIVADGNDADVASTVLGSNGFIIRTNINDSQKEWQFDNDGKFSAPGEVYGNFFTLRGGLAPGEELGALGYAGDYPDLYGTAGVRISTGEVESGPIWQFGTDGAITLPGDIKSESNIDIEINLSDSTLRRWSFGEDGVLNVAGDLRFPDGTNYSGNDITVPGDGIPAAISNINSSGSWESNPTSDLATTGGTGTGLRVNIGDFESGYAGVITIATAGTGYTDGDTITVTSGSSSATFTISVTANTWTFGTDGDITLPAGGSVVDSVGVGQLANRVEGSWTLPDDSTNTYSFTVPSDGTYIMWVKGNIPNGIITWNATVSVSNSNVPAIGTQYAWNYTGGGTPIELINLPNQIRGTAGTISTDATYAGTTSNRFDFDISNTSGAEQTVYYGYTKI
jgi:hypothetical protein